MKENASFMTCQYVVANGSDADLVPFWRELNAANFFPLVVSFNRFQRYFCLLYPGPTHPTPPVKIVYLFN